MGGGVGNAASAEVIDGGGVLPLLGYGDVADRGDVGISHDADLSG